MELSEQYISHYTNYDIAKKIINNRTFQLNNPAYMNDGLEFSGTTMDCSKLYFSSFSIESGENIGMWSMYGQPWEEGIKISIPKKAFLTWAEQIREIYYVDPDTYETDKNKYTTLDSFKPSISRVAYAEFGKHGTVTQIRCGERNRNEKIENVDSPILTCYIKDSAWSYEKEIRLRVDLKEKTGAKKIAIELPRNILDKIVVTTGPRFNKKDIEKEFIGITDIRQSIFTGKLNYIYCDRCKAKA